MLKFHHEDRHKYDDIIDLPRPILAGRPPMPVSDRAAQFAPFSALTGHSAAVKETARLTKERIELDENCKAVIDRQLQCLRKLEDKEPSAVITYFTEDTKKPGGVYVTVTGHVKKIDEYKRILILTDQTEIPIDEIIEIESQDIVRFT